MGSDVFAPVLPRRCELPDSGAARDRKESHVVVRLVPHVVGQAEALGHRLAREVEPRGFPPGGIQERQRIARGARAIPLIDTVGVEEPASYGIALELLDDLVDLAYLGVPALEQALDRTPYTEML